jgi:hypothetical protein
VPNRKGKTGASVKQKLDIVPKLLYCAVKVGNVPKGTCLNQSALHTDVRAGLRPAAMAKKWMIGRAAMLADAEQGGPPQNALRGTQIDDQIPGSAKILIGD